MKKKELTNVDKFYIANNLNTDIDVLVKEIDKPKHLVEEYVAELKAIKVTDTKHITTTKKADISNMFAKKNGAVIMTEGAAQHGDNLQKSKQLDKTGYIHKIK